MLKRKIICSISGGVDSAVSALLLKRMGLEVCGVYMKNWDTRDEKGHCQSDEDREYASRVCDKLDIPLTEVNFVKEYWTGVFQPMLDQAEKGMTTNPDVYCNKRIKFNLLHQKCAEIFNTENFVVATGHYCGTSLGKRVLSENFCHSQKVHLLRAKDTYKDQTMFLHKITEKALRQTYFPLHHISKTEVKEIAKNSEIGFTLDRRESIGICFVGKRKFSDFVSTYIPPRRGNFVDLESKKVLAKHTGIHQFTVGQRAGIAGMSIAYAVLHRCNETGNVIVVPSTEHEALYSRSFITDSLHWISDIPEKYKNKSFFRCQMRQNHRFPLTKCTVNLLENSKALIVSDFPLRSLTIGQDAILYDDEICLGGGTICNIGPSLHECKNEQNVNFSWFRDDIKLWSELVGKYKSALTKKADNSDLEMMNKMNELRSRMFYGATILESKSKKLEL